MHVQLCIVPTLSYYCVESCALIIMHGLNGGFIYLQGRDEAIVQLCKESFKGSPVYKPHHGNKPSFTIKHYAGDVSETCIEC